MGSIRKDYIHKQQSKLACSKITLFPARLSTKTQHFLNERQFETKEKTPTRNVLYVSFFQLGILSLPFFFSFPVGMANLVSPLGSSREELLERRDRKLNFLRLRTGSPFRSFRQGRQEKFWIFASSIGELHKFPQVDSCAIDPAQRERDHGRRRRAGEIWRSKFHAPAAPL